MKNSHEQQQTRQNMIDMTFRQISGVIETWGGSSVTEFTGIDTIDYRFSGSQKRR